MSEPAVPNVESRFVVKVGDVYGVIVANTPKRLWWQRRRRQPIWTMGKWERP